MLSRPISLLIALLILATVAPGIATAAPRPTAEQSLLALLPLAPEQLAWLCAELRAGGVFSFLPVEFHLARYLAARLPIACPWLALGQLELARALIPPATTPPAARWLQKLVSEAPMLGSLPQQVVNPRQVYGYNNLIRDLGYLAALYPDLISVWSYATSVEGRPIPVVRLGSGHRSVLLTGSIHAREWMTTNLLMYQLEYYAKAATENKVLWGFDLRALLEETSLVVIPMVNPDGVVKAQSNRAYRTWKANANGVDLNRQFPVNWEKTPITKPSPAGYRGPAPLSEPEAAALFRLTQALRPEASVMYHSRGGLIYWYFNQQGADKARDLVLAQRISRTTYYPLLTERVTDPSYIGGGYKDWFIETFRRPSFTIEIGWEVNDQPVELYQWNHIWRENCDVAAILLDYAATQPD